MYRTTCEGRASQHTGHMGNKARDMCRSTSPRAAPPLFTIKNSYVASVQNDTLVLAADPGTVMSANAIVGWAQ